MGNLARTASIAVDSRSRGSDPQRKWPPIFLRRNELKPTVRKRAVWAFIRIIPV